MNKKLFYLKLTHTIIWAFFVSLITYVLYAGIFNQINVYTWIAIGFVIMEGIILLTFKGKCPLTIIGYKYTDQHDVGFDIYLPRWLAKYNKMIFSTIFVIGLLIVIFRLLT
ncbi:MAG TPA: hypothetical protein DDY49_01300 [Paenibacillaceae bacterium]|nr:hypothetical protein [Paenibacillaceae bacterium]